MPCQIGMTTRPEERKAEWTQQRPSLRNWQILDTCGSKTAAQRREKELAQQYGCNYGSGGDGPERAAWYVYYFQY